jgi:hypothetical protein
VQESARPSVSVYVRLFPCLATLEASADDTIDLVDQMIVEEGLFDLGKLDSGKGVEAKSNAVLWRQRGDHQPLIGEYAFQAKFDRRDDLHPRVQRRVEDFFTVLQNVAGDWVSLGTTKTGAVYRLRGNRPQNHE